MGGPLRAISEFSGAAVWGVNNNSYQARGRARQCCALRMLRGALTPRLNRSQISRGETLNAKTGHHDHCRFVKARALETQRSVRRAHAR